MLMEIDVFVSRAGEIVDFLQQIIYKPTNYVTVKD
jgi:hypothetical protein